MIIRKCLKVPVHYNTTESKIWILDRLTARVTYGISLISSLVTEDTKLDRKTLRLIIKEHNISTKTGLSSGFVEQAMDKVIWSWRSYKALRHDWERKMDPAKERLEGARDDKEKTKAQKYIDKLAKREPSKPTFETKTPCRIDLRTGRIERGKNSFSLWMHISTLHKGKTIDVPLNPSCYHLKQLEGAEVKDFEIVQKKKKYYVHISISKEIPEKQTSSIGGIDQGLNRTIAVVLLGEGIGPNPALLQGELLCDIEKRNLIDKYDDIIASCQEAGATKKLKQLRNKRSNVAIYHDWCLAKQVAEYTEGYNIAIGNTRFRQSQYRGNGMPGLRKRVGKWSYGRQRQCIVLKRAELGYNTALIDERYTSKTCHVCGSRLVQRVWLGELSYIKCHSCNLKDDADLNAAHNIALRCQVDWLKVRMNPAENWASA